MAASEFEDEAVAGGEVGGGQFEWGVRIVAEGIGTCLIKKNIGGRGEKEPVEILVEEFEKLGAIGFCGQGNGAVVGAVGVATGLHIAIRLIVSEIISIKREAAGPRAVGEKGGGTVAVVKVEIEDGTCADGACGAERFESKDEAVKSTETFPVIGTSVVESAGDGGGDTVAEGGLSGGEDGAVGQENGGVEARAPWESLRFGKSTRISCFDGANIFRGMNAEKVCWGKGSGAKEMNAGEASGAIGDELKLFDRHSVFADGSGGVGVMKGFDHNWVGGSKGIGVEPVG